MTSLVADLREALLGPCGVAPRAHIVVACSGGRDSMVLLDALHQLAGPLELQLSVVTIDHGWRDDSGRDADLVREVAAELGLPWTSRSAESDPAVLRDAGPEAAARAARHAALLDIARRIGASAIAMGHHRDDQAETVLMRALVGTGVRGLGGMRPRAGRLIRPMLGIGGDRVERHARERELRWREDPANSDPRYLRSRIRGRLMPHVVEVIGPSGPSQLAKLADRCAADEAVLADLASRWLRDAAQDDGGVAASSLADLDPALAVRVVAQMASALEPEAVVRSPHLEAALRLAAGPPRIAGVDLPAGVRIERDGDTLRVVRNHSAPPQPQDVELVLEGWTPWRAAGIAVRSRVHGDHASVGRGQGAGRWIAWFDLDRLTTPLCVRKFAPGSRFLPFEGNGTKKISDMQGEARIPRLLRPVWPVVWDAERILWVPGVRAADVAKVDGETTRILELAAGEIQ